MSKIMKETLGINSTLESNILIYIFPYVILMNLDRLLSEEEIAVYYVYVGHSSCSI